MDDLKKELEMDEHVISLEELMNRFQTNPQTVGAFTFFKLFAKHHFSSFYYTSTNKLLVLYRRHMTLHSLIFKSTPPN